MLQRLLHVLQAEFASSTAVTNLQILGKSWGMCSQHCDTLRGTLNRMIEVVLQAKVAICF